MESWPTDTRISNGPVQKGKSKGKGKEKESHRAFYPALDHGAMAAVTLVEEHGRLEWKSAVNTSKGNPEYIAFGSTTNTGLRSKRETFRIRNACKSIPVYSPSSIAYTPHNNLATRRTRGRKFPIFQMGAFSFICTRRISCGHIFQMSISLPNLCETRSLKMPRLRERWKSSTHTQVICWRPSSDRIQRRRGASSLLFLWAT